MTGTPAFAENWSVNYEEIDWPKTVIGIYQHGSPQPAGNEEIRRKGILTSEGWLPPAPHTTVFPVSQVGDTPNSIPATRERALAKRTRTIIDPVELQAEISDAVMVQSEKVTPAIRHLSGLDIEFFIPDELTETEKADLIVAGVEAAKKNCVEDFSEPVTKDDVANCLAEFYDVSPQIAAIAVDRSDTNVE